MAFDRESYNACLKDFLQKKPAGADQKKFFCMGAKICSGKLASVAEAEHICSQPKPPKAPGVKRGGKCLEKVDEIVDCLVKNTDFKAENLNAALSASIQHCVCGKKQTKTSKADAALAQMPPEQVEAMKLVAQMQSIFQGGQQSENKKV